MLVPQCDRCRKVRVQVIAVCGVELCNTCVLAFKAWARVTPINERSTVTIGDIQADVCSYFGVKLEDMLAADRRRVVCFPRMIAMYVCRNRLGASFPEIGRAFAKDHTTVINAVAKVDELLAQDDERVLAAIDALLARREGEAA